MRAFEGRVRRRSVGRVRASMVGGQVGPVLWGKYG